MESLAQSRRKLADNEEEMARSVSGANPRSGWIAAIEPGGTILVDWEENRAGPLPARTLVEIQPEEAAARREVFLLFDGGDLARPVIAGLFQPPPSAQATAAVRRRVLEVQDELVLRCGEASITLRRDEAIIRAPYIESRAAQTHRVRGGSVQIN